MRPQDLFDLNFHGNEFIIEEKEKGGYKVTVKIQTGIEEIHCSIFHLPTQTAIERLLPAFMRATLSSIRGYK